MKVTVTFGGTALVVPCKGGWTVRDLIDQATQRYRKLLDQDGEWAVRTQHLEYPDGGILDPDDLLADLLDDRDKLVALFEEVRYDSRAYSVGSGSNGPSSPASSPEPDQYRYHLHPLEPISQAEIEVNAASLKASTPLMVRSSSDPALAAFLSAGTPPPDPNPGSRPQTDVGIHAVTLRGGAAERLRADPPASRMSHVTLSSLTKKVELSGEQGPLGIHVVPYCSSLSGRMLGLHIKSVDPNSRTRREGILREDESIVGINDTELIDKTFTQSQEVFRQAMSSSLVRLEVLPAANKQRYEKSLIGQLFTGEGHDAAPKARSPLVVIRGRTDPQPDPQAQSILEPRSQSRPDPQSQSTLEPRSQSRPDPQAQSILEPRSQSRPDPQAQSTLEPRSQFKADPQSQSKPESKPSVDVRSRTPEPVALGPPPELRPGPGAAERPPGASPTPPVSGGPVQRARSLSPAPLGLANLTPKAGGRKHRIDLKKGSEGLGFTVVTRDSSLHGPGPILIKNILPRGAAVKDGRLQPGDRILEVNEVDMAGRTQEELVAMLRSTKQGETVSMVITRQDEVFVPRELKVEEAVPVKAESGREQLMFEVPLNDTGSAGLGVSLKGTRSRETGEDLGICIKSIIHGGAAYKDGRLRVNDQLIAVNGESLLGRSNHAAMETLRHSMSWESTARGTIQLVLLRAGPTPGGTRPGEAPPGGPPLAQEGHNELPPQIQAPEGPTQHRGPLNNHGPPALDPIGPSGPIQTVPNYHNPRAAAESVPAGHPPPTDGLHGSHDDEDDDSGVKGAEERFPPARSLGSAAELKAEIKPRQSEWESEDGPLIRPSDNTPRNRTSKSMDMVADESNMRSQVVNRPEVSGGGAAPLGPTLGLMKSSSLESLQTAVQEARQSRSQSPVPFHRPRPNVARGRAVNMSFRAAIDKSYDGPSEDEDVSELSSGRDTPASGSSRQDLDAPDDGKKKKKTKGKKKEKKSKGKKKGEEGSEEQEKKSKRKGFSLLRFGKKDKGKAEAKAGKLKLEALSEEELDRRTEERVRAEPRYTDVRDGYVTPESRSLPDVEDDDLDPNYARINAFRPAPAPSRTPSPQPRAPGPHQGGHSRQPSAEDLDGLYAKVNKQRPPAAPSQNQQDSERVHQLRGEFQQLRAAPGYEELEAARRRALEPDPQRTAVRGPDARPAPRYEDLERQFTTQPRRADRYDHPPSSRPGPHPSGYPAYTQPPRQPPQQADPRYPPPAPHRAAAGQDAPPSPTRGRREPPHYAQQASPDRYGYADGRPADPRQKNPLIGAV